ncbi:MAG: 5-formyltetrahydrofolate cyclo-ligase [Rhodobiaceae bacterium]|nr:5-formyltetrahydrofolate cyclo-ligase [Rhodobiaceae bacterium]MCC0013116.1 5-formyltetrahydrofolate cyclo-ligase [Rhodobiaceae bacterium]MCC0018506.1 5-formyltetrahydrofolate cyclo-ligase [Rhodobiaceae bacterium]
MSDSDILARRKAGQRTAALSKRDGLYAGLRERASREACENLLDVLLGLPATQAVSAFLASRSEIDTAHAVKVLQRRGTPIGMPVVIKRGLPLVFRRLRLGDRTVTGAYGIEMPPETAEIIEPSVFIVPLAAFDRRGYRIGYGGGFYDRTLELARSKRQVLAVGFAFACQEIGQVVRESFDQPLDMIVTERETIYCR